MVTEVNLQTRLQHIDFNRLKLTLNDLITNTTIEQLNLSWNNFGSHPKINEIIDLLCELIKKNTTIRILNMAGNHFDKLSSANRRKLFHAVYENTFLYELNIDSNGLDINGNEYRYVRACLIRNKEHQKIETDILSARRQQVDEIFGVCQSIAQDTLLPKPIWLTILLYLLPRKETQQNRAQQLGLCLALLHFVNGPRRQRTLTTTLPSNSEKVLEDALFEAIINNNLTFFKQPKTENTLQVFSSRKSHKRKRLDIKSEKLTQTETQLKKLHL